jgi:Domain of unknown function (DUF4166)
MRQRQPSLYETALGPAWPRLAPAVRRFHGLSGQHRLRGYVETEAPSSAIAAWLAVLLGVPRRSGSGGFVFEVDARPDCELWTRRFPERTMASRLECVDGRLVESLANVRLTFVLSERDGALHIRLGEARWHGLPFPQALRPRVEAEERDVDGRLHFDVRADMPLAGRVTRYRGFLDVPDVPDMPGVET